MLFGALRPFRMQRFSNIMCSDPCALVIVTYLYTYMCVAHAYDFVHRALEQRILKAPAASDSVFFIRKSQTGAMMPFDSTVADGRGFRPLGDIH